MGAAAIDQLSSLFEADHQFLRKYLAENNCPDEFLSQLHSSGVLDMMPELLKSYSNIQNDVIIEINSPTKGLAYQEVKMVEISWETNGWLPLVDIFVLSLIHI